MMAEKKYMLRLEDQATNFVQIAIQRLNVPQGGGFGHISFCVTGLGNLCHEVQLTSQQHHNTLKSVKILFTAIFYMMNSVCTTALFFRNWHRIGL